MECHVPCHISIYWVWDSVKQSEGWGKNPALIARSPTRHSTFFTENFHHKSSLLVGLPNASKQRRKKRTQPPPKENLLGNFSGPKEKLSRPVVDTKTL